MFTAFVQKYKVLTGIVTCLLVAGLIYGGKKVYDSSTQKLLPAPPPALVYLPDSYIKYLLRKTIDAQAAQVYDVKNYSFYDVVSVAASTGKAFKLVLIKNEDVAESTADNAKATALLYADKAALAKHYAAENFLEKKISVSLVGQKIKIEIPGITGAPISLANYDLANINLRIQDSTLNHVQTGAASISFTPKGVVAAYNASTIFLKNGVNYFDSKPEFQNLGFSAMYPYSFLSTYMDTVKVTYLSDNILAKNIRITGVKITNKSADLIDAKFAIRHPLFPTDFTGKLEMTKSANKIMAFSDVKYDAGATLSAAERTWMNDKVKLLNDSIFPKLINISLAPSLKKAKVLVTAPSIRIERPIKKGQLRYNNDCVIFKIELI